MRGGTSSPGGRSSTNFGSRRISRTSLDRHCRADTLRKASAGSWPCGKSLFVLGVVFLLGWITAEHISDRWRRSRNRVSGFSLASLAVVLTASGYGLYYTTDRLHDVASFIHEVVGAAAIGFALTHWWRNSQRVQS